MQSLGILFVDFLKDLRSAVMPPGVPIAWLICSGKDRVADGGPLIVMPEESQGDEVECVDPGG